jgi:glutamyl-Q tRNA(Asp) synthetase
VQQAALTSIKRELWLSFLFYRKAIMLSPLKPPNHTGQYIGRFAPSPSGQLHFGSMVAAVGSYLQAKANQGLWLVRMEDIDPPREVAGSASHILKTLELYGLHWDQSVLWQSQQSEIYREVLDWLAQTDRSYLCRCTRKQINQSYIDSGQPGIYQRSCRDLDLNQANCAVRLKNDTPVSQFTDGLQGLVTSANPAGFADDFIIYRKDELVAYQLAVVVDDILQGITEVVRGSDLLSTTLNQMSLYNTFGQPLIKYLHLPMAVTEPGVKLSKQTHAKPVFQGSQHNTQQNHRHPHQQERQQTLINVLEFLGFDINVEDKQSLLYQPVEAILQWAVRHWSVQIVPNEPELQIHLS